MCSIAAAFQRRFRLAARGGAALERAWFLPEQAESPANSTHGFDVVVLAQCVARERMAEA
jgi:hypothetical protein